MNNAFQARTLLSIFHSPLPRIPDGTLALVSLISCRKPFSEYEKKTSTTSAPFCRSKLWYLFRQQEEWILHIPCRLMSWFVSEFVFLVLSYRSGCGPSTATFGNLGIVTHSHASSAAELYLSLWNSERLGNVSQHDVSARLFIVINAMC